MKTGSSRCHNNTFHKVNENFINTILTTETSNEKPKLVVGHLMNDQLLVQSVATSKSFDWLKWLETEELVEFFAELFKLLTRISESKKDAETLSIFLSE